ncbi:MAG: FAD-dependent oxidoreductase [Chloroflexota bacterium]
MGVNTIIVGAGLAGLVIANELQAQGVSYLLLEKAPMVGGRLSTYTTDVGVADEGAQFFSARESDFQEAVQAWQAEGLVYEYGTDWSDGSIKKTVPNSEKRYAVQGGMVRLAEHLASGLRGLETEAVVKTIRHFEGQWYVTFTDDRVAKSQNIVLTAPVPVSLKLLAEVTLDDDVRDALSRIHYAPNITAVFTVDGDTNLPDSSGVQLNDDESILRWVVDNQKQDASNTAHLLTVQTNRIFSKQNIGKSDADILDALTTALQEFLVDGTRITDSHLVRWQYASPITTHPNEILRNSDQTLIFAGDAFGGRGRMEGAYISGKAAAHAVIESMQPVSD